MPTLNKIEEALRKIENNPVRDNSLIPELLRLHIQMGRVQDDHEDAHEILEAIMIEIGKQAVPMLIQMADSKNTDEQTAALDLLRIVARYGDLQIVDVAKEMLSSKTHEIHHVAIELLAVAADERAVEILIEELETTDDLVNRIYAVRALGDLRDMRAVDPLVQMLNESDKSWGSAQYIIFALEQIGTVQAIEGIHNWKQSVLGKAHVEKSANYAILLLQSESSNYWDRTLFPRTNELPRDEADRLRQEILMLTLSKALRVPALSGRAELTLKRFETAEAERILKVWSAEKETG